MVWHPNHSAGDCLNSSAVCAMADKKSHISYVVYDPSCQFPSVSSEWRYVVSNTDFTPLSPLASHCPRPKLWWRDNFGILTENHSFLLPSTSESTEGLDGAHIILAERMRHYWKASSTPTALMKLLMFPTVQGVIYPILLPRGYPNLP